MQSVNNGNMKTDRKWLNEVTAVCTGTPTVTIITESDGVTETWLSQNWTGLPLWKLMIIQCLDGWKAWNERLQEQTSVGKDEQILLKSIEWSHSCIWRLFSWKKNCWWKCQNLVVPGLQRFHSGRWWPGCWTQLSPQWCRLPRLL